MSDIPDSNLFDSIFLLIEEAGEILHRFELELLQVLVQSRKRKFQI